MLSKQVVAWHLVKTLHEAVLETRSSAISLSLPIYDDGIEIYGYGIILIMIVTMLWHPVLHGYNKPLYNLALTFWLLRTFGQMAMSEHSTMASKLQFGQVIETSNINTISWYKPPSWSTMSS